MIKLTTEDLIQYLKTKNWYRIQLKRGDHAILYQNDELKNWLLPSQVILPTDICADYNEAIQRAIENLTCAYQKTEHEIVLEILKVKMTEDEFQNVLEIEEVKKQLEEISNIIYNAEPFPNEQFNNLLNKLQSIRESQLNQLRKGENE